MGRLAGFIQMERYLVLKRKGKPAKQCINNDVANCFIFIRRFVRLKVLSNGKGGGGEWYQSISFSKLSCRQVSFFGPKGTPSREEHKMPGGVLTTFIGALTNWCRKIRQNVSP